MERKQLSQIDENKQAILQKLGHLDLLLQSLGGVHEDNQEKIDEIHKKISTKKLILMDEMLKLISPIS